MRNIDISIISQKVEESVIKINYELDNSLVGLIKKAKQKETKGVAKSILNDILENAEIAKQGNVPLCQDTGVVVVMLEVGFEVHFNGDVYDAINQGVRSGYEK